MINKSSGIEEQIVLAPFTSLKVGGPADYFILPKSIEEILSALSWAKQSKIPYFVLGGGTNVLVSDKGVRGLVICLKNFLGIEDASTETHLRINCKAGTPKMKAMRFFLKENLEPSLFLSGLPGDVAGGVVMNAGVSEEVSPKEFYEIVESFKVIENIDGEFQKKEYQGKNIKWLYRKSEGWGPGVITEVVLTWPKKHNPENMKLKVKEAQELRSSKQPLNMPSCGSVFKNPYEDPKNTEKRSAGYLIENAGLKGYQYGGAEISRKHANFIINKDAATALDVHCTISLAKEKVKYLTGITLNTEVKYFGDWEGLI